MMIVKRDKYIIHIPETVLSIFDEHKQTKFQNESGGIILGFICKDKNIHISKVSLPNIFDKSSIYNFERDKHIAQIIVDFEFYNSNGKIIYLGEWHTHPEKNPSPSLVDIKMIKQQYKKNKINENFLILLIQGMRDLYIGIYNGENLIEE